MKYYGIPLGICAVSFLLLGASCTLKGSADTVLQTSNKGKTWESKSLVKGAGGKLLRLTTADALYLAVNPKNSLNLFLGTREQGLFISDNAATHWTQMISGQEIVDVALDPTARCTLYVAIPTKLLRTVNCAETWDIVYNETRKARITSIALDSADAMTVYISTDAGDIFKSMNQGMSWNAMYRIERTHISKVFIDSVDTAIVTAITKDARVMRSFDKGSTWTDITPSHEIQLRRGNYVTSQFSRDKEHFFLVTSEGLWKYNGGQQWTFIRPLTPVGSAEIRTGVMNIHNENEIYYATKNTFYHSVDNGAHWTAQVLPTTRWPSTLTIDPNNPSILYMGLQKEQEKNPYL